MEGLNEIFGKLFKKNCYTIINYNLNIVTDRHVL